MNVIATVLAFLMLPAAQQAPHGAPPAQHPRVSPVVAPEQYRVFRPDGRPASLDDVAAAMDAVDVVFVGEEHDDPGAHALELELLARAFGRTAGKRPVALSLEMFERDVQPVVDEYLAGLITEKHFLSSSRPWARYETDYRPTVEFARAHKIPVVAANAPGRYANRAARLGRASLDELPASAKPWLPPLPYGEPDPAYAAKFKALMGGHGAGPAAHAPLHLLDGQALWDAAMGYSIAETLKQRPGALVLHVNGGFHSEERLGILTQLSRYRPNTRMLVVSVYSGRGFPSFDAEKLGRLGDFVILTDPALKPAKE